MKNILKKGICLILIMTMIIPVFSNFGIFASEENTINSVKESNTVTEELAYASSGTCGDNLTWEYNNISRTLTISGTGDMYDYHSDTSSNGEEITSAPWGNCTIISIIISDGVTSIGGHAFYNCGSLTRVNIGNSVTSIGDYAFYKCKSLTSVTIPDSVTSIDRRAFEYCSSLTSVTIPDSVKSIGYEAFCYCSSLRSVTIPDSITSIGDAAFYETALYNDSSNWDKGLYIGNHLIEARSLIIKEGTKCIADGAFSYIGGGFVVGWTSVTIPDSVTSIGGYAFNSCKSLTSVTIPDSVTYIGGGAFYDCKSLTSVTIPDSVTYIGEDVFYGTALYNDSSNWKNNVLYIGNHLIKADTSISGTYEIKEGTKCIAGSAFQGCKSLTSVTVPDSVTSIGDEAFWLCSSLTSVTIPNSVTIIGDYAFYYCSSMTSVTIGNSVTSIGYAAFEYCINLRSVRIPYSVTSIGKNAFAYCARFTIKCYEGSYAAKYANLNSFPVEYIICTHSFTDYISDNNGTCTEDGTKTAYCDNGCGTTDTIVEENSKRHDYILDVLREPTCTKTGSGIYMCSICKDYYTALLPAIDHLYTDYVYNQDATCMVDGTKTAYCDYGCGHISTLIAEGTVVPCKYADYTYNKDATCTSDGTMTAYCEFGCGSSDTVTAPGTMTDHAYISEIVEEPTCTSEGVAIYMCPDCRYYYSASIPVTDHVGEWIVTIEPTTQTEGEKTFTCTVCGHTETDVVPTIGDPVMSTNNYDVSLTGAEYIKYVRYALGDYNSASEIKNAEGCVTLNASKISSYTKEGICTIAMPDGGIYSLWVKLNDGTEYIYKADLSIMEQEIEADGVTMTVKNLYGVKDYFIAKGEHTTYADVKANSVVQITKNKIVTSHDYTYILSEPGTYTVCVRYDDSTRAHKFITVELTVVEPAFTENGLQLKVSNLDGVKVIRTAYGDYDTPGQIKKAVGARAFTGKTVLKGLDEYSIQYRDEGLVTVAVVYNNGYEVIYKYNVTKKSPGFTQEGNTVTFTNLEDFKVIRYAVGVYTTSNQIKNAKGSVTVSAKNMTKASYSVTLAPGTYTFCVQYNDESYNYYTVTVE